MKKPTIFTLNEKALLVDVIEKSIQTSAPLTEERRAKLETLAIDIICKLNSDWDYYYSIESVNLIERAIKNCLQPFADQIQQLLASPLSEFMQKHQYEEVDFKLVDLCNTILRKLGRKTKNINFNNIIQRINGVRATDEINRQTASFEWEPIAKSETLLFELIPGESGVGSINTSPAIGSNSGSNNNLFIDLITEPQAA